MIKSDLCICGHHKTYHAIPANHNLRTSHCTAFLDNMGCGANNLCCNCKTFIPKQIYSLGKKEAKKGVRKNRIK